MCGRFEIHTAIEIIAKLFGLHEGGAAFPPNYNVAPGQEILIIINDNTRRMVRSRWGLVPSWAKDLSTGYTMINARAETLAEKPSFRVPFEKQRCLVVADGFFEWKKVGKEKKPFYIRLRSHEPFGFAGLYSVWTSPEGERIWTSTIITTDANELVLPIHDRMPVIAPPASFDLWLDPAVHEKDLLMRVLKPYPAREMESYPVTPRMNSVRYNAPENIRRTSGEP